MNVKRTVRGYAQVGLASIMIEDQVLDCACFMVCFCSLGLAARRIDMDMDINDSSLELILTCPPPACRVVRSIHPSHIRPSSTLTVSFKVSPKRCGHTKGKQVVEREEAFARIQVSPRSPSGMHLHSTLAVPHQRQHYLRAHWHPKCKSIIT
jgi:hypothetical protein